MLMLVPPGDVLHVYTYVYVYVYVKTGVGTAGGGGGGCTSMLTVEGIWDYVYI